MSNNTSDNFELPANQDKEAQSADPTVLNTDQAEQATGAETNEVVSPEDMLPPEARGEVNGGPLGCCLGVTVGLFLSLTLAILSRFYPDPLVALFQHNYGLMGLIIRILMGLLAVVLAFFCGRLGWKLGKRFFREYEPPVVKERKRRSQPQKIQ